MSNTSTNKTANKPTKSNKDKDKLRVIVGEIGRDTKTGILGRGYSYDNGKTFRVTDTMYGRLYGTDDIDAIWSNGTSDRVKREVDSATAEIPAAVSAANSAVSAAESAVAASKVNSDAIVAQSEAISEAKAAMDSATAEIQQTAANAASDAAKIRADVAQVQSEVDTAKAANSASVEALKSDVSAAKQDIQAARQANENVAKQLDDYTKQAQAQGKTIKDIQDAQDGYTATLADVKGNVSKISDAVDGLSASLKDDQDNVATIKAKADELSATLTDHDKNITQLTASAKKLSSTLEDADGRLSKVEQTASTLVSEFSDQQGHLNRVEQTAQSTQQTVANQQGQINSIQTDASGIHETLTGQGSQIANINVTLNGLNTKYEGVSGDLGKLKDQVTTNSTQITQNKKEIDLKADQSTVNTLSGEVNQNEAQLKVQADQISSKVSSDDFKTLDNKVGGAIAQIQKNSTAIDQTNKQISLKADQTEVDKVKQTASQNSSRLNVMAGEISSKVTSTDVNNIVDSKGYATTSTVQSLITQKAGTINESITSLDSKYNTTVTKVQSLTASIDGLQSTVANKADKSQITQLSNVIQSKVSSSDFNNLRKAVDLQTLDSADINNMKTNGHYFVRNLANNPVGGWVYVDVTGNGADRIRQDVYQDNGNQHKYRRWFGDSWTAWSQGATESEITQLRDDINLQVKSDDLLSQINIQAGRTLIQSQKIYMDADSVIMGPNTRAFIPSAAIASLDADKITTGVLNGIDIHQIATKEGRTIDIENGNISISSNDVVEPRLSFINKGAMTKAFNAIGDLETLDQHFMLFNFKPSDTQSMHPISYFTVNNVGDKGSGNAQIQFDHAMLNGHEWWANSDGITFGRSWDGAHGSADYVNLYAKSFAQNSELSAKTRIEKLDKKEALDKIMQDDMYTYQYKSDVRDGSSKRYASFIIDNVNDVAQYREPAEFLSANRHGRDDGTQLAYLIAAFQYQQHEIEELKVQLKEKKANE